MLGMEMVDSANVIPAPMRDDHILEAYAALAHLSAYYPGFKDWYWTKVVPGLGTTRRLDIVRREGRIVGVCIAKRTEIERKICTLWVVPAYRGTGLGVRMLLDAMHWLGTSKPAVTVNEERYLDFVAIFRRLSFQPAKAVVGLYRPGKIEYLYHCD